MLRGREWWLKETAEVRAVWSECEMTSDTTGPPPWPGTASQQPLVSPKPKSVGLPVKSLSSHWMKMTEFPFQAEDFMILPTHVERNESPVLIRLWTWLKSQGSAGVAARPCMSLHWSGAMNE